MLEEQTSTKQLQELEKLRLELRQLRQEKSDLEILLETTTTHADALVETLQETFLQLSETNQQLQTEIVKRQRVEAVLQTSQAELQSLLTIVSRDKDDLEILLEMTTEHSDTVAAELQSKAEEAVRESDRRLARFLEAVPVGVAVLDSSGKTYYINHTAQQLLGQGIVPTATVEQLPQVYQIYLAETLQLYPAEQMPLVRALRGESTTVDDMEIHHRDRIIPIESRGTFIFDDSGNIAYAIAAFQDITERKKAEAEQKMFTDQLFQLNKAYERFVPHQFLQLLDKESIVDVQLGDQVQKEMSVLFADVRDFTTLSESMLPEENFKFINSYLSRMEPAILTHNGFIDKYIGDGIMALFSGSADDAVTAGINMIHALAEYNQDREKSGYFPIRIGIGINTGSLMLGTVGGHSRMDGTVISDAVNLASRLQELTKDYDTPLLISHETFLQLKNPGQYSIRLIERVKVKGKSNPVSVFEVFDGDPLSIRGGKLFTAKTFEKALVLYNLQRFSEAEQLFADCLKINPKDKATQIYLERCQQQTRLSEDMSPGK